MAILNWTEGSIDDLRKIGEYIAIDYQKYALIHVKRIREKAQILKLHPKSGRVVPEIGNEEIRELVYGNYRIIYKIVDENRVDVLTVYHSA
jgi:toxin ParE1/3/4